MAESVLKPTNFELAEVILSDEVVRQRYDDTKMHWIGDPEPRSRTTGNTPWVKRVRGNNEYVYSLPVVAAFSIARSSLFSVRKDPWHHHEDPHAWFIGEHNLLSGEVHEPDVLSARVDEANRLWLQVAGDTPATKFAELNRLPRDQRRYEMDLDHDYHAVKAEYRSGLRLAAVKYEDIVALESTMRMICQARQLQLPRTVQPLPVGMMAAA